MDANKRKVALESLKKVRLYSNDCNYGRAFAHYLVYLELLPNKKADNESSFTKILYSWGMLLEEQKRVEDLCKCYIQAMLYFPTSSVIFNNFGAHLLRLNEPLAGKRYLELATLFDADYLPAEKNLQAAKTWLLPRWHFRMLNDSNRNHAYLKALQSQIDDQHNEIIDIGTGSGILSLYAHSMPATKSVTAIEESKILCEIAREVFRAHKADVKLVNSNSTDVSEQAKANLLVTEVFDTAVFGEHVLETMLDAWKRLLVPDAKVVPQSAVVYVAGIKCGDMYRSFKLVEEIPELRLVDVCVSKVSYETYEAENVAASQGMDILTDTKEVVRVDFRNVAEMERLTCDRDYFEPVVLESCKNDVLDGFVVWFDLQLSEDVVITTHPFEKNVKCWDQAVFYLRHSVSVTEGQKLEVLPSLPEEQLHLRLLRDRVQCADCFKVSQATLRFLNDVRLVREIKSVAERLRGKRDLVVVDVNVFPLFGLLVAQHGARVYCLVNPEDVDFVKYLVSLNNLVNFCVIPRGELDSFYKDMEPVDVIFVNPVGSDGTVLVDDLIDIPDFVPKLKWNGIIIPEDIKVAFQVVNSEEIFNINRIDNTCLFGYELADFFKDYVILEQGGMNKNTEYTPLSDPMLTDSLAYCDSQVVKSYDVPVHTAGLAHAIVYWFDFTWFKDCQSRFETLGSGYYSLACFLLPEPRALERDDTVKIKFKQHKGFMSLYDCSP